MSTHKAAIEYERFVELLYHAVQQADEEIANLTTLKLERRKRIRNRYGALREFDVYWEYDIDGTVLKTVIECKHHNSPIPIRDMDALVGKISDIEEDLIPVFATKTRYQSGARQAADHHGVELLVVREQKESDWKAEDGVAFARYIIIKVEMFDVPHIHDLRLDLARNRSDGAAASDTVLLNNDERIIQENQDLYSIKEFVNLLHPPYSREYGRFQRQRKFQDGYLLHPTRGKLELHSLTVDYSVGPPWTQTTKLDGTTALLGVIEYVQRGVKKLVFRNCDVERIVTRRLE